MAPRKAINREGGMMDDRLDRIESQLGQIIATLTETVDSLQKENAHLRKVLLMSAVVERKEGRKRQRTAQEVYDYIKNARQYIGDREFTYFLNIGMMPRRKLLKLAKVSAKDLDQLLSRLTMERKIMTRTAKNEEGKPEVVYEYLQ